MEGRTYNTVEHTQRAFVLTQLQRLTPEDVANIIYLEGCTELQGKGAIEVFQQLQKKSGVAASYLESVSSIFHDIGRKDLALAVSRFSLTQSGAEERAGIMKRVKSEKSVGQSANIHVHNVRLSLPTNLIGQPLNTESVCVADDHVCSSHQLTSNEECTPADQANRLSPIDSEGIGETDSLTSNRHSPASESEICRHEPPESQPPELEQKFSEEFGWKIRRDKLNAAIYGHKRDIVFRSPNPLPVPIDGFNKPIKIRFALHHNGLDKDLGVYTTLEASVTLADSFKGQSVPSDTKLILSAGACESGGKLLKGVTVESPLNVQTVRLLEFVSHQQLKDSASEYIFIKAGCKAISAFHFKETESPDPDDMGFLLIDKVDDHE